MEARVNIKGIIKIPSAFKCYYGVNAYGMMDYNRNKENTTVNCLRYSSMETWEYVVQYHKTIEMQLKFIIDLHKDLKKIEKETMSNK